MAYKRNIRNKEKEKEKKIITKVVAMICVVLTLACTTMSCKKIDDDKTLYVYNWGLYIADHIVEDFEKKYGIKVVYDMYDTNEEMYAVLKKKARTYDVLCPTDYMIEKMIHEGLLYSYDFSDLHNIKSVDKKMLDIMKAFDKDNTYAIPYVHSTLGIIYNKTLLDKKGLPYPTSWADLFDDRYKGEVIMQDAMRDVMMVGLKKNHYSLNTKNDIELRKATDDLIKQRDIVSSYAIDSARDKMAIGEGSIAVMYSGEVEYIRTEGKNFEYEYILPTEGVNFTIDAWVIPKDSMHKKNAKLWIDFMLDKDIAFRNFEYMHYGISNIEAIDEVKKIYGTDMIDDEAIFPDLSDIDSYELYRDIGDYEEKYLEYYKEIKSK